MDTIKRTRDGTIYYSFVKMLMDIRYAHAVAYGQFIYDILYEGEYDD